jgi:hypothetical protein
MYSIELFYQKGDTGWDISITDTDTEEVKLYRTDADFHALYHYRPAPDMWMPDGDIVWEWHRLRWRNEFALPNNRVKARKVLVQMLKKGEL